MSRVPDDYERAFYAESAMLMERPAKHRESAMPV
jgi:hypothetical protein